MTTRERTIAAAVEAVVGAAMLIGGLLLTRASGFALALAWVLILFGAVGLGHSVALGLGLIDPPGRDGHDNDSRRH